MSAFRLRPTLPAIVGLLTLGVLSPLRAAIYSVPSMAYPNIQAGVDAAQPGDTVLVSDGTYTGPGNVDIDFGGKSITVKSLHGATRTIIDCRGGPSSLHRGFRLHSLETAATIDGFTVRNGNAPVGDAPYPSTASFGGGIEATSGTTVANCILTGNTADFGGGIYGGAIITNCTVTGNTAGYGGGIYASHATITGCTVSDNVVSATGYGGGIEGTDTNVTGCTVSRNAAGYGGGIDDYTNDGLYAYNIITNCKVTDNTADGDSSGDNPAVVGGVATGGGGIHIVGSISGCTITGNTTSGEGGGILTVSVEITDCTISGNTAGMSGGGIEGGAMTTRCTITGNTTSGPGGGIHSFGGSVTDSTVSGNRAGTAGGGLWVIAMRMTNCAVFRNSAASGGGAVLARDGGSAFINCTITENTAGTGPGSGIELVNSPPGDMSYTGGAILNCILWNDQSVGAGEISYADDPNSFAYRVNHNDIRGGYTGSGSGPGNIDADPLFVSAANDDFRLQPGSPCLAVGTASGAPMTDKDGVTRPDPPSMGAYECEYAWSAVGLSVGTDGFTRLLWTRTDGLAAVWKVDASGHLITQQQYGPYLGWTARAIATGGDNSTHLFWTKGDGTVSYYLLNADNVFVSQQQYGPYTGWTARGLAAETDGTARALWTNGNGTATVWTLDAANNMTGQHQYGPYYGVYVYPVTQMWTAKSLTVNPDGSERLLWTLPDGTAAFWHLDAQSGFLDQHQYGPYAGYTAASIAAAPDGTGRVVWNAADGHIGLWTLDADNLYTGQSQFGPYRGWAYHGVAIGSDGNARLLWDNVTGQSALWSLTPGGAFALNSPFGPY